MATLKHVNASKNGASPELYQEIQMPQQPFIPREHVIFRLCDKGKKGRVHLSAIADAFHPVTNTIQRMRLINGVSEVWMKEQKDLDKDVVKVGLRSLAFENQYLKVDTADEAAITFLRHHPDFVGYDKNKAPNRFFAFYEYDPQAIQRAELDKELFEMDMALEASKQPEEFMKKHAMHLGIAAIDELGRAKTPDGIRREYMVAAKRNPKLFKETLNSKVVEISYLVKKAVIDGTIDMQAQNGMTRFAAGGEICKIPSTRNGIEYLVELAMTNSSEGKAFLQGLQALAQ